MKILIILIGFLFSFSFSVSALERETHKLVNEQAVSQSSLNTILVYQLGVPEGINTTLKFGEESLSILRWLREGGAREDDGNIFNLSARYLRHFHDPLCPWDSAGLHPVLPFASRWESAVRWAQETTQNQQTGLGDYSWRNARASFHQALIAETPAEREAAWAQTFRALGQVMHVLTDMAVPEHVRDDMHPIDGPFGYEGWVLAQHRGAAGPEGLALYLQNPPPIDPALFSIPIAAEEPIAKAPLARLFDSDRYTGANPAVTAEPLIGLAEVTNANFFSPDTIGTAYAEPARDRLEVYQTVYDKTGTLRSYSRKPAPGLVVEPVLVECALDELAGAQQVCADDAVWRATAAHLLPRTVGYAAALLDHFFRGKIEFEMRPGADATTRQFVVTNRSFERLEGTVVLYADAADGTRTAVPAAAIADLALDPGATVPGVPFPVPPPATGYVLVFQGTLGQEAGVVIGKVVQPRVVFAVQESVGLMGEEIRLSQENTLWLPPGVVMRYKEQGHQQAAGTFVLPGEANPEEQIAAVRLVFGQPPEAGDSVVLYLTGASGETRAVGHEWVRTAGLSFVPVHWRLAAQVPQAEGCFGFACAQLGGFPRALDVSTTAGFTWRTPLLWWGDVRTRAESMVNYLTPLITERVQATQIEAVVVFGGGEQSPQGLLAPFAATAGIAGLDPGAILEESTRGPLLCDYEGFFFPCRSGTYISQTIRVFADAFPVAGLGSGTQATLRWCSGELAVIPLPDDYSDLFPPLDPFPLGEPPALPPLTFTRTYLPSELALLEPLGVTPPAYTVQVLP